MTKFMNILKSIIKWVLPYGFYDLIIMYKKNKKNKLKKIEKEILSRNLNLKGIHKNEKCFILATGPSILKQNLLKLKDNICLAVSDFYKHKDYKCIKPIYYFIAPMHAPFNEDDIKRRLEELMKYRWGDETYFFSIKEKYLVEKSGLHKLAKNVFYLHFINRDKLIDEIDLVKGLQYPFSVTVVALSAAIYMGFSKIYLLGCDHDKLWKWDGKSQLKLDHFYNGTPSIGYEILDIDRSLEAHLNVRKQYSAINKVAKKYGISIYNANPNSYIDIFPKINFDDIFVT